MATTKRPAPKKPIARAAAPAKPAPAVAPAKPAQAATPATKKSAAAKPAAAPAAKTPKPKKPKRVRGEFKMPKADYERIAKLKATAERVGVKVKKNELLRLGLQALQGMPAAELKDAVLALRLPRVNAGR